MKHTTKITALLVALFIFTQVFGLGIISQSMDIVTQEDGTVAVTYQDTAIGERPDTQGASSFLLLIIGVGLGTILLLILIKFKQMLVWKAWYFLAVTMTVTVALGALIAVGVAVALALGLAVWKVFRPNIIIHNLTEVLVYTGIALLISPLLDVLWASAVLIAIALYDMYAVWKSKHMITMAEFQTDSKLFAGMIIPYGKTNLSAPVKKVTSSKNMAPQKKNTSGTTKSAILGGGDIAFPLIFSATVLDWLIQQGLSLGVAFSLSMVLVATSAAGLFGLFWLAKPDRFYPAMPPVVIGSFIGWGIVWLIVQTLV